MSSDLKACPTLGTAPGPPEDTQLPAAARPSLSLTSVKTEVPKLARQSTAVHESEGARSSTAGLNAPPEQTLPAVQTRAPYTTDDLVEIWSNSTKRWYGDGIVAEVYLNGNILVH